MNPNMISMLIMGILIIGFLVDNLLEWINLKAQRKELPEEVSDFYEKDQYFKSIAYQNTRTRFSFITGTWSFLLIIGMLAFGGFGWLDDFLRAYFETEIFISLAFFGVLMIGADLLSLPFQWYSTFVIEERFGFNKSTVGLFITDKLKGWLLTVLIGGGLLYLLVWLIQTMGPDFWIWFWLASIGFMLVMNMFYTTLILPLFNKLKPLESGSLRDKIEAYCKEVNFPLTNVYVIDGSKRSSKSNAFFSGFGKKKKIVLYDTLINNHTEEELVSILAHEAGHYKKKHIISGLVVGVLQTGLMLFILSLMVFSQDLSYALGGSGLTIHLNLLGFAILYAPVSSLLGLLMNIVSRKHEFQADHFAATTYDPESLKNALKKLSVSNLSNLFPHPAYVFFHYSHPPLLQRLAAISQTAKEN